MSESAELRLGDQTITLPIIEGSAWISAHSELIFDPNDPFRHGIGP